jgi:hypothetical protein
MLSQGQSAVASVEIEQGLGVFVAAVLDVEDENGVAGRTDPLEHLAFQGDEAAVETGRSRLFQQPSV